MKESIVKRLIDKLFGPSKAEREAVAKLEAKLAAKKSKRTKALVSTTAVLALAASLPGCSALANALGVDPRATAPAYSGVGVVMLASPNGRVTGVKTDQSGAVGATGSANTDSDQTSSAEIPEDAIPALVQAAQTLLSSGQTDAAKALLGAIAPKKAEKKPADATEKPPAPAPAAPTAPEPVKVPDAPAAPAEPAR